MCDSKNKVSERKRQRIRKVNIQHEKVFLYVESTKNLDDMLIFNCCFFSSLGKKESERVRGRNVVHFIVAISR